MKRVALYITTFVMIFSLSVIYHLPMSFVVQSLPKIPELSIDQVQGTVWQGNAASVSVRASRTERVHVGEVQWEFQWSQLLKGNVEYAIKFGRGSNMSLSGKGNVGYRLAGAYLEGVTASLPANQIQPYIQSPVPLDIQGQVELAIKHVQFEQQICAEGEGTVAWINNQVGTPIGELYFGPVIADLNCLQGVLEAKGEQDNEQTESQFSAVLNSNHSFKAEMWFKPKSGFPSSMQSQLKWLGNPNSKGQYPFSYQGKL